MRVLMLGLLKSLWPLLLVLPCIGWLLRAAIPVPELSTTVTGLLFMALAVAVAAAANYSRDRLQKFLKGARGEEAVARTLAMLPDSFSVFHGLASSTRSLQAAQGGADIDHVVAGPNGVFVIETKNWSGTITLEEDRLLCDNVLPDSDPLDQVAKAAASLRRRIMEGGGPTINIIPVLCFASQPYAETRTAIRGVVVCSEANLCEIIQNTPAKPLSEAQLEIITRLLMPTLGP